MLSQASEPFPSHRWLAALRDRGATTPLFLPAVRHPLRRPAGVVPLWVIAAFALIIGVGALVTTERHPLVAGAALMFALWCVFLTVNGRRLGTVLDRGRMGVRHPLRPGTVWVDLDRVEVVIPVISIGANLSGATRGGKRYRGPAGVKTALTLWSRGQGCRGITGWVARRMIPRQRRLLTDAESHLGRLRAIRIDDECYTARCYAAVLLHLANQLPPYQAEQVRDIAQYAAMLERWAQHGFDAGGRHRRDWRRDPRELDPADLDYGPAPTPR